MLKPRVLGDKKFILFIIFICFIGGIVFIFYNFLPSLTDLTKTGHLVEPPLEHHSPPSVVIEQGSGVESASYIIFKDDEGLTYAKNGSTGAIDYSSTNASYVIQSAIDALTNGGKIFIKAGTHQLDGYVSIIDANNLGLFGEEGTVIQATDSLAGHATEQYRSMFITMRGSDIRFSGITFDGQNKTVYSALYLSQMSPNDPTYRVTVDHCNFINFLHPTAGKEFMTMVIFSLGGEDYKIHHNYFENVGEGIAFDGTRWNNKRHIVSENTFVNYRRIAVNFEDSGGSTRAFVNNQVVNNAFHEGTTYSENTSAINFIMDNDVADTDNVFSENTIDGEGSFSNGIVLTATDRNIVSSNTIRNCTNALYGAISLRGVQNSTISENILYNNDGSITEIDYDGRESENNMIANNLLQNNIETISVVGTYTLVKDNKGAPTENYGTATVPAGSTSVWVTHGLIAQPTNVLLTPTQGYNRYVWWSGANSTHIRVWAIPLNATDTFDIQFYASVYQQQG